MIKIHNIQKLLDRRKELRKNQTPQEEKLWWYLKDKRLGIKFRRQHSIGGYIVDFYCKEKNLIIELDGEIHNKIEAKEYDLVRDKFLKELGFKVLRFRNLEIEENIEKVLKKVRIFL
ncbi:MAG TPA: endonuclease domain-containing protein [Candidatus Paceibacterota bacterium]